MKPIIALSHDLFKWLTLPLLLCVMMIGVADASAQKMAIASFKENASDLTASLDPTMRRDANGDKCALIKIETTQKDFSFDVGALGVTAVEWQNTLHPGEIWLYVPKGVMKISIQHPQFGSIKDYDLGGRLSAGRTYDMKLTSDEVSTIVVDYNNSQVLDIEIFPPDARLIINGMQQPLDLNGKASPRLSFGTHRYRVTADKYHPVESQLTINDKTNGQKLKVRLPQAFGYLDVAGAPGAEVFVDGVQVGITPLSHAEVKSGKHEVKVKRKLFFPFVQQINMTDSAFVMVTPEYKANSANYEITVAGDRDAMIYDNGDYLGQGSWKGQLEAGTHLIEARKENHNTTTEKITVAKDVAGRVSLSAPTGKFGQLMLTTVPDEVEVYVDGKSAVFYPKTASGYTLPIGRHQVKLSKSGYTTEEFTVYIQENKTERVTRSLSAFADFKITSNPPSAYVEIDGRYDGRTPYNFYRLAGSYQIVVSKSGYASWKKTMKVDGNTKNINITLHQDFVRQNEFYLQAGASAVNMLAFTAGLGFYYRNVNMEANYFLGFTKSENIYWNAISSPAEPYQCLYKPWGCDVKMGYGIRLGSRVRLTPQVGVQFTLLKEEPEYFYLPDDYYNDYHDYVSSYDTAYDSKAVSISVGARLNVAICNHLGISITPAYLKGISYSEGYKALKDVSSKIKGFSDGFSCNLSLNFFL